MAEMKRLQGYEQEALLHLYAIITMAHHLESLDKRLKLIPNGTRTLGQLKYASRKLLEGIMSTVPTEQVVVQQRNLDHLGYRVGICRVDNNPMADEGRWISNGCIVERWKSSGSTACSATKAMTSSASANCARRSANSL